MRITCREVRTRRGGVSQALAAIGALLGVPLLVGGVGIFLKTPLLFLVGAALLVPWIVRMVRSRPRPGVVVHVTPELLEIDGEPVPTDRIEGAWESDPRALVILLRDRTRFELALEHETADEVLTALDYDLSKRTLRAPLRGALGPFTQGFITFVASMLGLGRLLADRPIGLLVTFALSIVATALVVRRFGSPRVVIGADGLRVEGGLRARFVPFSAIARVRAEAGGALVELRSGGSLALPTVAQEDAQREALVRRIEAGRAAYSGPSARDIRALDRGGRSFEAWRRDLALLPGREPGFREQALSTERLERELCDVSAPIERRLGAAIVLKSLDADPQRLRIVAGTFADDEVQSAIEAICDDTLSEADLASVCRTRR